MPLLTFKFYVQVCVQPQVFSKSIDTWLWNFAYLFTICPQPVHRRMSLIKNFDRIMPLLDIDFMLSVRSITDIFQFHWQLALRLCSLVHHHTPTFLTADLWLLSVSMTLQLRVLVLCIFYHFIMLQICAKLFQKPLMQDRVISLKWFSYTLTCNCDLELWTRILSKGMTSHLIMLHICAKLS
jgi:hypothetical protein